MNLGAVGRLRERMAAAGSAMLITNLPDVTICAGSPDRTPACWCGPPANCLPRTGVTSRKAAQESPGWSCW